MDFLFIGNNLAADFVNTEVISLQGRTDLLTGPEALSKWFAAAGCAEGIKCSQRDLEEARELRDSIRRTFDLVTTSQPVKGADIQLFNKRGNELVRVLSASQNKFKLEFRLQSAADVLALIADTTCQLLASARLNSVRKCASDRCVLYFVDTSKNQHRQWCSMDICGNREKVRKHYDKNRGQ